MYDIFDRDDTTHTSKEDNNKIEETDVIGEPGIIWHGMGWERCLRSGARIQVSGSDARLSKLRFCT